MPLSGKQSGHHYSRHCPCKAEGIVCTLECHCSVIFVRIRYDLESFHSFLQLVYFKPQDKLAGLLREQEHRTREERDRQLEV